MKRSRFFVNSWLLPVLCPLRVRIDMSSSSSFLLLLLCFSQLYDARKKMKIIHWTCVKFLFSIMFKLYLCVKFQSGDKFLSKLILLLVQVVLFVPLWLSNKRPKRYSDKKNTRSTYRNSIRALSN